MRLSRKFWAMEVVRKLINKDKVDNVEAVKLIRAICNMGILEANKVYKDIRG